MNRSFKDYSIVNEDRIFIVLIEQMNSKTEAFWRNATKNILDEKEKFALTHDSRSKLLLAQNNDLALLKAESRSSSNRCLLENLKFCIDDRYSTSFPTNLSSNFPTEISNDILPALW
jgi:hypothetical protein